MLVVVLMTQGGRGGGGGVARITYDSAQKHGNVTKTGRVAQLITPPSVSLLPRSVTCTITIGTTVTFVRIYITFRHHWCPGCFSSLKQGQLHSLPNGTHTDTHTCANVRAKIIADHGNFAATKSLYTYIGRMTVYNRQNILTERAQY